MATKFGLLIHRPVLCHEVYYYLGITRISHSMDNLSLSSSHLLIAGSSAEDYFAPQFSGRLAGNPPSLS